MTQWLNSIAQMIQDNMWIAPVLSFFAGILTSFTPCSLSSVPMAIAYIGGSAAEDKKKALKLSLTMALGMALTFGRQGYRMKNGGYVDKRISFYSILCAVISLLFACFMCYQIGRAHV